MRDGHAWSGSEYGDAVVAPSLFNNGSTTLEQAFGLYQAAFSATSQLLPGDNHLRATLSPSDGSANVFEKQDSTTQEDCAVSSPPLKRSRRSSHIPELRGPQQWLGRSANKGFPKKMPHSRVQSEQTHQTRAQKRERGSAEESGILAQHHNAALCVC